MGVVITNVTISKNPVNTKETFKISVAVKETVTEPTMYRFCLLYTSPSPRD